MRLAARLIAFAMLMVWAMGASTALAADGARADWARLFEDAGATGTLLVVDERDGKRHVHDDARARQRFVPASTFKIPHLLFALDAGIATDASQIFRWDGVPRRFAHWNRDQTLRDAMRGSTVWVFQGFAKALGERRERRYLRRIGYGNRSIAGGIDRFWLDGGLAISAIEQIAFLQRLRRDALPFDVAHQQLVKDLLVIERSLIERGPGFALHGKTGWAFDAEPQLGWFVGWVDTADGAVFFALNIDMPGGAADAPKREAIVRKALASIGALPTPPEPPRPGG
jgi:beta-lactamase class D